MSARHALLAGLAALAALAPAQESEYPSESVRFLAQVPLKGFPGSPGSGSGISGYVSKGGREYAVMGLRNGYGVVDITQPRLPQVVGHVGSVQSIWHEVAVLGDFAYTVSEGGGGMQIIDLRSVDQGLVNLAGVFNAGGYSRGHTVQANPASKTVYIHGSGQLNSNGGIIALDAADPINPVLRGVWRERYVHDAQIVTFTSGPNAGREISFACCGGDGLFIVDVTDKTAMRTVGSLRYVENGYCHSGALTPDGRYYLVNDEFDEANGVFNSATTHIIDVSDLTAPKYVGAFTTGLGVIDHNSMIQDGHLMLAAYRGGLRVYDVRQGAAAITETGHLDTYPTGDGFTFDGAWGTFAGFPSGNVVVSDINRGLFVMDPSEAKGMGAPIDAATSNASFDYAAAPLTLRRADGQTANLNGSGRGSDLVRLDVLFRSSVTTPRKLRLTLEGRSDSGGERVQVQVRNPGNRRYETVGEWSLRSETSRFVSRELPSRLVGQRGRIEVRLQISSRKGVRARLDMVQATVLR